MFCYTNYKTEHWQGQDSLTDEKGMSSKKDQTPHEWREIQCVLPVILSLFQGEAYLQKCYIRQRVQLWVITPHTKKLT